MTEKIPEGIKRQILTSHLRASAAHKPSYARIAQEISTWFAAHAATSTERQEAKGMTRGKVERMIEHLREDYPWFDEMLDYLDFGRRPENYWDFLVLYVYFVHGNFEDTGRALRIKPTAVRQATSRLLKTADPHGRIKGLMWLARLAYEDRKETIQYGGRSWLHYGTTIERKATRRKVQREASKAARKTQTVRDPAGYAIAWAKRRALPEFMWPDLVQEAQLAAVEHNNDAREISRALDRYRRREYKAPMNTSGLPGSGDTFRLSHLPRELADPAARIPKIARRGRSNHKDL